MIELYVEYVLQGVFTSNVSRIDESLWHNADQLSVMSVTALCRWSRKSGWLV